MQFSSIIILIFIYIDLSISLKSKKVSSMLIYDKEGVWPSYPHDIWRNRHLGARQSVQDLEEVLRPPRQGSPVAQKPRHHSEPHWSFSALEPREQPSTAARQGWSSGAADAAWIFSAFPKSLALATSDEGEMEPLGS